MKLFQIDYLKKTGALLKEVFAFKKYKAMHPALATFVGIFMSPFLVVGLLLTAILAVFAFVVNLLFTPLKHIHSLFQTEAKGVMHATQFIIYAISWPIFYLVYFAFSWLFIVIYLLYALLSIIMYIFTLGGFKYHISPNFDSDDIAIKTKGRFFGLPVVTICVSAVLLVTMVIFGSLAVVASAELSELYSEYEELDAKYEKLEKEAKKAANTPALAKAAEVEEEAPAEEEAADAEAADDEAVEEEAVEEEATKEENTKEDVATTPVDNNKLEAAKEKRDAAIDAYNEKYSSVMLYLVIAAAAAGISFLTNMLMSLIGYAPRCIDNGDECCCEATEAVVEEAPVAAEVNA